MPGFCCLNLYKSSRPWECGKGKRGGEEEGERKERGGERKGREKGLRKGREEEEERREKEKGEGHKVEKEMSVCLYT